MVVMTMLRAVFQAPFSFAGMVKLVDTMDSKSIGLAAVPVRLRLPVPLSSITASIIVLRAINRTLGVDLFVTNCPIKKPAGLIGSMSLSGQSSTRMSLHEAIILKDDALASLDTTYLEKQHPPCSKDFSLNSTYWR